MPIESRVGMLSRSGALCVLNILWPRLSCFGGTAYNALIRFLGRIAQLRLPKLLYKFVYDLGPVAVRSQLTVESPCHTTSCIQVTIEAKPSLTGSPGTSGLSVDSHGGGLIEDFRRVGGLHP